MNLRAFAFICIYAGSNPIKPLRRSTPNGEEQNRPFQLSFNTANPRLRFPIDSRGIIECKARLARPGQVCGVRSRHPGRICGTHQKLCGNYQASEVCHSMLCRSPLQVLWKMQTHPECPPRRITPLECILTKNAPVSPVECALTGFFGLKSLGINTYIKMGGWGCLPRSLVPFVSSASPSLRRGLICSVARHESTGG